MALLIALLETAREKVALLFILHQVFRYLYSLGFLGCKYLECKIARHYHLSLCSIFLRLLPHLSAFQKVDTDKLLTDKSVTHRLFHFFCARVSIEFGWRQKMLELSCMRKNANTKRVKWSEDSLIKLEQHGVFSFAIKDPEIQEQVFILQEMIHQAKEEEDHVDVMNAFLTEIEEKIRQLPHQEEIYLLNSLQNFREEMKFLLEMDNDDTDMENIVSLSKNHSRHKKENEATKPSNGAKLADWFVPTKENKVSSFFLSKNKEEPKQKSCSIDSDTMPATTATMSKFSNTSIDIVAPMMEDLCCTICMTADSAEDDPIVLCDLCNVPVHQSCYRIDYLPDDNWYCQPCQQVLHEKKCGNMDVIPTPLIHCVACLQPNDTNAFVATSDGQWIHMVCSMYLPELFLQDTPTRQQVVCGLELLKPRRTLRCCFCKKV
jgi:hypothetical protein